jgi:predicted nucleic acid-binding protein
MWLTMSKDCERIAMNQSSLAVIDASVAVYSIINTPMASLAMELMDDFQTKRTRLYAPRLWWYEVTSLVHKYRYDGLLTEKFAQDALAVLLSLGVNRIEEDDALCRVAFDWATQLTQKPAYDSFFFATAERLSAEFWTADQRLVNRAQQLGISWVHWMGENPH